MANKWNLVVALARSTRALCALLTMTVIASCGGGGNGGAASVATTGNSSAGTDAGASNTDLGIAKTTYSPDERAPADFYRETENYSDRSVFRFHVRSGDIAGIYENVPTAFELCSDDFAEALSWSQESAQSRQLESNLTSNTSTPWFFEFERALAADDTAMVVNRVFKCASIDRAGLDDGGYAGQVRKNPFTADDLKFVAEYLWTFSIYNNALHAVISSEASIVNNDLTHTLTRAEVKIGAGAEAGCDRIELWQWQHSAAAADGSLFSDESFLRSFDARIQNGEVSLCSQ